MACLGEESRFRLVKALTGGPRCVTDLASEVGLSQSCTTRHLQALERRRIVRGARSGKRVMYGLREDEPALGPLLSWALREWAGVRSPANGIALAPRPTRNSRPKASAGASPSPVVAQSPPAEQGAGVGEPTPAVAPTVPARVRGSEIEDFLL